MEDTFIIFSAVMMSSLVCFLVSYVAAALSSFFFVASFTVRSSPFDTVLALDWAV